MTSADLAGKLATLGRDRYLHITVEPDDDGSDVLCVTMMKRGEHVDDVVAGISVDPDSIEFVNLLFGLIESTG